jgi:hypothetical protein
MGWATFWAIIFPNSSGHPANNGQLCPCMIKNGYPYPFRIHPTFLLLRLTHCEENGFLKSEMLSL